MSGMTYEEILRDAEDMAKHYQSDRLKLTGAEILDFVARIRAEERAAFKAEVLAVLGRMATLSRPDILAAIEALGAKEAPKPDLRRLEPRNEGHGHVRPRPDGVRARCGGPGMCRVCQLEKATHD